MENFEIRTYGRTELALCYFPDLNPQVAYRKLQRGRVRVPPPP